MAATIRVAVASPPIEARRWATCRSTPGAANRARRRSRRRGRDVRRRRSPAGPWARALLRRSSSRKNGMPSLRSMARSSSTRPRRRPSGSRWASSSSSDGESRSSGSWWALGQGGAELVARREDEQDPGHVRGDDAAHQLERGRVGPLEVVHHEQQRSPLGRGGHEVDEGVEQRAVAPGAVELGGRAPRRRRDLEQVGEQRDRRCPAHDLHHVPQPGQRVVGSLARVDAGRPLEQAAHREQRGGAVVGGAVRHQGGPVVGLDGRRSTSARRDFPTPAWPVRAIVRWPPARTSSQAPTSARPAASDRRTG